MGTLVTTSFYLLLAVTAVVVLGSLVRGGRRRASVPFDPEEAIPSGDPAHDAGSGRAGSPPDPTPTIGQLLEGVELPFDLRPTVARVADPRRHAVFLSRHPDPDALGVAFADELVRAGYAIEPAGRDEALAIRGRHVLSLRITPRAASVRSGGRPRYPTAGASDLAVEIWTGQGPPPPVTG